MDRGARHGRGRGGRRARAAVESCGSELQQLGAAHGRGPREQNRRVPQRPLGGPPSIRQPGLQQRQGAMGVDLHGRPRRFGLASFRRRRPRGAARARGGGDGGGRRALSVRPRGASPEQAGGLLGRRVARRAGARRRGVGARMGGRRGRAPASSAQGPLDGARARADQEGALPGGVRRTQRHCLLRGRVGLQRAQEEVDRLARRLRSARRSGPQPARPPLGERAPQPDGGVRRPIRRGAPSVVPAGRHVEV
mmetsp:Transcript_14425/g.27719  ORF Transcript_14425/g.27719 Transcript_14425/m.27719 type:complete len:251 (-) Transcript_14425:458-1210(-)